MINERVLRAVRELSPEQQECVVLRFLHGMSLAETALIMGKNSGAIKALQFRAIRALAGRSPRTCGRESALIGRAARNPAAAPSLGVVRRITQGGRERSWTNRRSRRCASGGCAGARHARRTGRHDDPAEPRHGAPHDPPRPRATGTRPAGDRGHDRLHRPRRPRRAAAPARDGCRRTPRRSSPASPSCATRSAGRAPEFRARLRETLLSAHEELRRSAPEARPAPPRTGPRRPPPYPPPAFRPSLRVRLRSAALALALLAALLGMS